MARDTEKQESHSRCDACDHQKLRRMENDPSVRELRDKIEQMNFKLAKSRNENQVLKRNLLLAKQMMFKEIGAEASDYHALLKHGTEAGWKGRLENVLLLKNKVQELQDHLKQLEGQTSTPQESPSESFVKKRIPLERKAYWRMELERRQAREGAEKEMRPVIQECNELRKRLDAEKAKFRELNREMHMLRGELQAQVYKNEEDMGLVQSFHVLENQLQDTLTERAEIREALVGCKARNKRLGGEISSLKDELRIQYNKTKDNNMLIDTLTSKHKLIQDAIEAEKLIVKQNVERYKDELKHLKENYKTDVEILDSLQDIAYDKENLVRELHKTVSTGLLDDIDDLDEQKSVSSEPPSHTTEETSVDVESNVASVSPNPDNDVNKAQKDKQNKPPTNNDGAVGEDVESKPVVSQDSKSKIQLLTLECAKYRSLLKAAQIEKDRLSYVTSMQERQLNDIAVQVVETGRLIMQKNEEKKILSSKIQKLQKTLTDKRKKYSVSSDTKNRIAELTMKIEAQREENAFLRHFLATAAHKKASDLYLYRSFVTETKNFFVDSLQDIKQILISKSNSQQSVEDNADAKTDDDAPVNTSA